MIDQSWVLLLLGGANGALVANGQLVASTGAAARQNCAAILGLHALTESVSFSPFTVVGLERAFRHVAALSRFGMLFESRAGAEAQTSPMALPNLQYSGL